MRTIEDIVDEVDTLCNADGSPIMDEVNECIKELIKEAYEKGKLTSPYKAYIT
jgi:hypothetical protein